jgi:hypothetical protein
MARCTIDASVFVASARSDEIHSVSESKALLVTSSIGLSRSIDRSSELLVHLPLMAAMKRFESIKNLVHLPCNSVSLFLHLGF